MRCYSFKLILALAALGILAANAAAQVQLPPQALALAQSQLQTRALEQDGWPKSILVGAGTVINLYQPQVLSYTDSIVKSRYVISVQEDEDDDPVFGVAWTTIKVSPDTTGRELNVLSVRVDQLSIPDDTARVDNDFVAAAIKVYFPWVVKTMPVTDVQTSLALGRQVEALSKDTTVAGPRVYFVTQPAALILIDGEPRLEKNERWGLPVVANSRNVIIEGPDGIFYLYYAMRWYMAREATGSYTSTGFQVTKEMRQIQRDLLKAARKANAPLDETDAEDRRIIVSTKPAVMVGSDGVPQKEPVPGTSLLQVMNSRDYVFYDQRSDYYYALAAGNWYRAQTLKDATQWRPVRKADLPVDILLTMNGSLGAGSVTANGERSPEEAFGLGGVGIPGDGGSAIAQSAAAIRARAKLQETTEKTTRMEEQVPQTIRVDRQTTTTVDYDGPPRFRPILGTNLEYATNTCGIVVHANGRYYALDNGVWFIAGSPMGFWRVSDERPAGVELIPLQYRAYRAKFVYIYQTAAEYVYEGYLPGYYDAPTDGCALAASYDNNWNDIAWGFDLDCVFGWGSGYSGYFRFDRVNRYYGFLVYEGNRQGWHEKQYGPWSKSKGGGANGGNPGGGRPGDGGPIGGIRSGWAVRGTFPPHPPGGWSQRTGGYSGGGPAPFGGSTLFGAARAYSGGTSGSSHVAYSGNAGQRGSVGSGGSSSSRFANSGSGSRGYSGGGRAAGSGGSGRVSSSGGGGGGHVSSGGGSGGGGGGGGGGHVSSGGGGGGSAGSSGGGHH